VLEHVRRREAALRRDAAVGHEQHLRPRAGRDERGGDLQRRRVVVPVVRRAHAHEAGELLARDRGALAGRAREARDLVDRHALPAQRDQERADADLALLAVEDGEEGAVGLLVRQVASVPAVVGPEDAQEIPQNHAGSGPNLVSCLRSSRAYSVVLHRPASLLLLGVSPWIRGRRRA
jgi:hypothetical protein